jgi:hypothetical protein
VSWVTSTTTNTSGIGPLDQSSAFDGSGWVLSTGGGKAVGGARSQTEGVLPEAMGGLGLQTAALIAVAVVVVALLMRKKGR